MYDPNNHNGFGGSDGDEDKKGWTDRPGSSSGSNGTIWEGSSYHYYRTPEDGEKPRQDDAYHSQLPYRTYVEPVTEEKPKKHTFRKVLAGVLACMVVSAGSVAGFAALIDNGVVKFGSSSAGTSPVFTIAKDSASSSAAAPTTNTATAGELTKQQVAQKVVPSVVCIQSFSNKTRTTAYENGTTNGTAFFSFGNGDGSNDGGNGNGSGDSGNSDGGTAVSPTSEGSGIIATSDGYIVTNAHVVSDASTLKVILSSGKTYEAKLIGSDSVTDLALIKIDAAGLAAATFGSSDDLKVADTVMAVGNPGGEEFSSTVTVGYISALNREITNSETGYTMKAIQTDAAINPGNSGGALVNMKGQVVGINSSKIVATGYEGLGFAIPINTAQPIISELKAYGYVKDRAALGITGQYLDSMTARFYSMPTGMYVASVSSSYVSAAGIQKGDIITKIDGKTVSSQSTITSVVTGKKPGDTVTLSVSRPLSGQTFTAAVKLTQATGK